MKYKDFCQKLSSLLTSSFPENTFLNVQTVDQGNGILSEVLTIEAPGNNILPMFKLKDYYRSFTNGISLSEIGQEISHIYMMETSGYSPDIGRLSDFSAVKGRIVFRLMGRAHNKRLLSRIPHRKFLDLAIIYELRLPMKDGLWGSALIENAQLELWSVSEEELYQAALVNTPSLLPYTLTSISELIRQIGEGCAEPSFSPEEEGFWHFEEGTVPMFVLSNQVKTFGAGTLLYPGLLEQFSRHLGTFYLLPSSVHECILVPALAYVRPEDLRATVMDVNRSIVDAAEVLSDQLYIYDPAAGRLKLCTASC